MKLNTYIIQKNKKDLDKSDLDKLVDKLNAIENLGVNITESEISFFSKSKKGTCHILLTNQVKIETDIYDLNLLHIIRTLADELGYSLYMGDLDCTLPTNKFIDRISDFEFPEFIQKVFDELKLKPIFGFVNTYILYAIDTSGRIVLLNEHLLRHFMNFKMYEYSDELFYTVADSIQVFVTKMDEELVPTDFYAYYKKDQKIINMSGFNIDNPGRKIFVKPLIYEMEKSNGRFLMITTDRGSAIYCDKILPGENLDNTLKRVLRNHLKIAEDYVNALVLEPVEYDRDKEGKLIPRLIVKLYVPFDNLLEKFANKSDRQWLSEDEISYRG